jgi:hypothetical protein
MMRFKAVTRSLHSKKEDLFLHLKIKSLNSMTLGAEGTKKKFSYGSSQIILGQKRRGHNTDKKAINDKTQTTNFQINSNLQCPSNQTRNP